MQTPAEKAYRRATELWGAILRDGPQELVTKYLDLHETVMRSMPLDMPRLPIALEPQPPLQDDPVTIYPEWSALLGELRERALEMLRDGRLVAIGYDQNPSRPGAAPVWIAASYWVAGTFSWDESELWSDGKAFWKIKVVPGAPTTPRDVSNSNSPKRTRGGPSMSADIIVAYNKLANDGRIDFKTSLRANLPTIQEEVRTMLDPTSPYAIVRGIEYEAVRRAVGKKFSTDRAAIRARDMQDPGND